MENMFEKYFSEITNINEFLKAESMGFSVQFRTARPEMPGATFFHQICRCCLLDLIIYIFENREVDINELDFDDCTPLGYLVNDDLLVEMNECSEVKTVNLGCEDPNQIYNTIKYLIKIGCKSVYCGEMYDNQFTSDYLSNIYRILK